MKSVQSLVVILLSYPSLAVSIIAPDLPARRNSPDILMEEAVGEIAGVPIGINEPVPPLEEGEGIPVGLRIDDLDSGETESTGTEDDIEVINLAVLAFGNIALFAEVPLGLKEGHQRLRYVLLFYFHGRNNATLGQLDEFKQIAKYLRALKSFDAKHILEIAIEHGWSDLVVELLRLFQQRTFTFQLDINLLRMALQNRQFQVALQLMASPIVKIILKGGALLESDFAEMGFDEYEAEMVQQVLLEVVERDLMSDFEAAGVQQRIARQIAPDEPDVIELLALPLVVVAGQPLPKLEKRANSWGSTTIGSIGTIMQAAKRKTRSLFDKGYKERMQEKKDPPRRTSLKDDELDNLE